MQISKLLMKYNVRLTEDKSWHRWFRSQGYDVYATSLQYFQVSLCERMLKSVIIIL